MHSFFKDACYEYIVTVCILGANFLKKYLMENIAKSAKTINFHVFYFPKCIAKVSTLGTKTDFKRKRN